MQVFKFVRSATKKNATTNYIGDSQSSIKLFAVYPINYTSQR